MRAEDDAAGNGVGGDAAEGAAAWALRRAAARCPAKINVVGAEIRDGVGSSVSHVQGGRVVQMSREPGFDLSDE